MKYYIQDFCCICLSTSNEKFSKNSSKYPDDLTPFEKIESVFSELSAVMDNDSRICLKCCDKVDSIYEFHKTCLKNINILNSYKIVLNENKSKKLCELFVNLDISQQFKASSRTLEEVKIELSEVSQNNDNIFCDDTDHVFESHSNGIAEVKEEIEINFECYNGETEMPRLDSEIDIKIEPIVEENIWIDKMNKVSEDGSVNLNINQKDSETISPPLTQEMFVKEEENQELVADGLPKPAEEKTQENQILSEFNRQSQSSVRIILPEPVECSKTNNSKFRNRYIPLHSKRQTTRKRKKGKKPRHKCIICGKFYSLKNSLKSHMSIHTSENSHKCDICKKLFHRKDHLDSHILIHTDEKPYKCNFCEKSFGQKDQLKKHFSIHTLHKCDICGELFNRKDRFNSHMLIHTGKNPFKCDICGKSYNRKEFFKKHMSIHAGVTPFKCDICGKSFNRKNLLKSHMLLHKGGFL